MAYGNIIGCDLCAAVAAHGSDKITKIKIETSNTAGGDAREVSGLLCAKCANQPIETLIAALQVCNRDRDICAKRLDDRILAALERPVVRRPRRKR